MNAITLPSNCTYRTLVTTLAENAVFTSDWNKLPLIFPDNCFISTGAISFLCSWGLELLRTDRRITVVGRTRTTQYLSRMNLFRHLGIEYEETYERHSEVGRFIPLHLIDSSDAVLPAVEAIADLILHQFEDARNFLPAVEWAVCEIVDNIRIHSETPVPGAVCAQYFPERHRLDVGVCDMGRGIKASLAESYDLFSHGDAVTKALERGVTRNKEVGQGNGLAGSLEIAKANQGAFRIWTGNCLYDCTIARFHVFEAELPGTGLSLSLNTLQPVQLSSLFIGDSSWSYVDAECERIEEQGCLRIADECEHTGGREPARRLRYKILNLLPDYDGPLPLDFSNIQSASSSFFDELLGRLILRLGKDRFAQSIRVQNLSPELKDMANVVIHQRLESE